jgi:uncharacterized membrane protein YbaN (DUF454 family)
MRTSSRGKTRPGKVRDGSPERAFLDIELDERDGLARLADPRLFCESRRPFARRLLEALCAHSDVRRAEIDLATFTCSVDFDLTASMPAIMADVLVSAVRSASAGDRSAHWWRPQRRARWSTLTAYQSRGEVSIWESYADPSGAAHLRHRGPAIDRAARSWLSERIARVDGVERSGISRWSKQLTVSCGTAEAPVQRRTIDRLERILEGLPPIDPRGGTSTSGICRWVPSAAFGIAGGAKRLGYLTMAGGAFALTLVGLVVPGIPTVPFLLATSYYLARSSPRLDALLRRTPLFGPVLQEWEEHHAVSLSSKLKLMGLTGAIVVLTIVFVPMNPIAIPAIIVVASLSAYGIARMPSLEAEPHGALEVNGPKQLPAPAV